MLKKILCLSLIIATSCYGTKEYKGIVAYVNEDIITENDLEEQIKLFLFSIGQRSVSPQEKVSLSKEVLSKMINDKLKQQCAHKYEQFTKNKEWVSAKKVDEVFANIARQNDMSVAQFEKLLQSNRIKPSLLKAQIKLNLSWQEYIGARFSGKVYISDSEINQTLAEIKKRRNEEVYMLCKLSLSDEGQANMARQMIKNRVRFESIKNQLAPKSNNNYGANWIYKSQLTKDDLKILNSMNNGDIRLIKTDNGYNIIYLKDKKNSGAEKITTVKFCQVAVPLGEGYPEDVLRNFLTELKIQGKTASGVMKLAKNRAYISEPVSGPLEGLNPEIRPFIEGLNSGEVSKIHRVGGALFIICMLERSSKEIPLPTVNELKERKYEEALQKAEATEMRRLEQKAVIKKNLLKK